MVVVLSYFDHKIGPMVYRTYPKVEITESLKKVNAALDLKDEEGFISFKDNIRALSYLIYIDSPIRRGNKETVLLTYIITETQPNEDSYKGRLGEAAKQIKAIDDVYKAFVGTDEERWPYIQEIMIIMKNLDIDLRMRDITTVGYCIPRNSFDMGYMPVPNEAGTDKKTIESYLMVYKKEADGTFNIKGHPIYTEDVYKMEIFTDHLNMRMIPTITRAFQDLLNGRIVYTSGICRKFNVCSFELYFEHDGEGEVVSMFRERLLNEIDSSSDIYPMIIYSRVEMEGVPITVSDHA